MRNKLYIVTINNDEFTQIEFFLSNKQAMIYRDFLWELEDMAGIPRNDYLIVAHTLYTKAEDAIAADMALGLEEIEHEFT